MNELANIPGINESSLELLEAAGFLNARSLARSDSGQVATELKQANEVLRILDQAPPETEVSQWIGHAREIVGVEMDEDPPRAPEPTSYQVTAEDQAIVAKAPIAIPLPARVLTDQHLAVADIPPALLLNQHATHAGLSGSSHPRENRAPGLEGEAGKPVMILDNAGHRRSIDTSRVRSFDQVPLAPRTGKDRPPTEDKQLDSLRVPRSSPNKGPDPKSRRCLRGVLHSNPMGIYAGSLATFLLMLTAPFAAVSAILLLLSSEVPDHFSWVPQWIIVFPLVLPVLGMAYLVLALRCKCRICGLGLFHNRMHTNNSRAHHIRGLGYIFPLCIHILLFHWFRCTQCGTPVRLKE